MRSIGNILSALGRNGPVLLIASLLAGAALLPLSHFAADQVSASAFLLTLGSFLSASLSPPEDSVKKSRLILVLSFVGLFVPLATYVFVQSAHFDQATQSAVLLSFLAPPVGSAAAIATMLGLRPKLALATSVGLTLIAPLAMPTALTAFGIGIAADLTGIILRLFFIIGAAALITALVLRWRTQSRAILPDAGAAAGLSVIGLVIVGLTVAGGIAPTPGDSSRIVEGLELALGFNLTWVACGTVLFLSVGAREAGRAPGGKPECNPGLGGRRAKPARGCEDLSRHLRHSRAGAAAAAERHLTCLGLGCA